MELAELETKIEPVKQPGPQIGTLDLEHRSLRRDEFWREVPAYRGVSESEFHSHTFQMRHSVTGIEGLRDAVGELVSETFFKDVENGLAHAPMALRISPYLLSLIDWRDPYNDPIRTQFLPVGSQQLPDHPELDFDSLNELGDSPVPGLTHRYPDRALFLTLDTCPVYCRFCTRSYAVGMDTKDVAKVKMSARRARWDRVIEYIAHQEEIEDVVVSGGDTYNLRADQIRYIGHRLLDIPHIRRFRFATKGLAVMPARILTDSEWVDALAEVVRRGRQMHKQVVVHTHFNHPNEITGVTQDATDLLMDRGIVVRNQSVLQRGVNNDAETMKLLIRRLGYVNIEPYYVFFHDLVKGVEDLRTSLSSGLDIEKAARGVTSGFNMPTFVVDTLGGGGKRDAHSYEYYNPEEGIAVYTSPVVRPDRFFYYFDPIDSLGEAARRRWADPLKRQSMMAEAVAEAKSAL